MYPTIYWLLRLQCFWKVSKLSSVAWWLWSRSGRLCIREMVVNCLRVSVCLSSMVSKDLLLRFSYSSSIWQNWEWGIEITWDSISVHGGNLSMFQMFQWYTVDLIGARILTRLGLISIVALQSRSHSSTVYLSLTLSEVFCGFFGASKKHGLMFWRLI